MVAAAAAEAAGWGIKEIAAGVGVLGTVGGGVGQMSASGGSGWNFNGPPANVHYPNELGPQMFLGDHHQAGGLLIRFFADGYIWNNECTVNFHGIFSHSNEPPQCYNHEGYDRTVANRFMEVGFAKGGEELSSGLLSCGLSVYQSGVGGSPEDPYLIAHAEGHFDPVGRGDAEYSFNIYVSTFATVHLGEIERQTGGLRISQGSNHVEVYLDQ